MKKKSKNQVYIPHQDKWNEHFPTPGKPNPTNKQKHIYLILQGLQIILLILLETVILRIPNY